MVPHLVVGHRSVRRLPSWTRFARREQPRVAHGVLGFRFVVSESLWDE